MQDQCPEEGIQIGEERRLRSTSYADDLALLTTSQAGLQRMFEALYSYACLKGLEVNTKKTEVMVFGARMGAQRIAPPAYLYGPSRKEIVRVSGFKYLGLLQSEHGGMAPAVEARAVAFTSALQQARRTAIRVRLHNHITTRIRLAQVLAVPAANYGDVVWGTSLLQPNQSMRNPLQKTLLAHLKQAAGVPSSTPGWPLLSELGLKPMQLDWWKHILKFYNAAVSPAGQRHSPLMAAALAADMRLARSARRTSEGSWSGQLLAALGKLEEGRTEQPLKEAACELQPLPIEAVLELVRNSYERQQGSTTDPRDPATQHRAVATHASWFRPTAGCLLRYAARHASKKACNRVRANLRLRLGAVRTAVSMGARRRTAFEDRVCPDCEAAGGERSRGDIRPALFECPHMQQHLSMLNEQWARAEGPPGGATDFTTLYNGNIKAAMRYVEDAAAALEQAADSP